MQQNENESGSSLATKLRTARENAGLSQGQVARLLGIHRPTVSEIEAGRRKVSTDELVKFADLYSVDLQWLLQDSPEEENTKQSKIQIAARELSKLNKEDFDRIIDLLVSLRSNDEDQPKR